LEFTGSAGLFDEKGRRRHKHMFHWPAAFSGSHSATWREKQAWAESQDSPAPAPGNDDGLDLDWQKVKHGRERFFDEPAAPCVKKTTMCD
jgi:hypothetical protein